MLALITLTAMAACWLGLTSASPITKRASPLSVNDTQILQYACKSIEPRVRRMSLMIARSAFAVTAENLEHTFYSDALSKMDAAAFEAAGYPPWVRNRSAAVNDGLA